MSKPIMMMGAIPLVVGCLVPSGPDPSNDAAPVDAVSLARPASAGLVRRLMPAEDPGPPFYARVGYQTLESDGYVAIPFYRPTALIPPNFNLLEFYHFPGPAGPGAFAAPLLMTGFLLIEADAPHGTFPKQAELRGENIPVWFVPSAAFHAATQDGVLTVGELSALDPLIGTATRYHETLHPREGEHKIIIQAHGTLNDGRTFDLSLAHVHDELRSMRIAFR